MSEHAGIERRLREYWKGAFGPKSGTDYGLAVEVKTAFGGRTREGLPALVVPLPSVGPSAVGRASYGLELRSHVKTDFTIGGRSWTGAAAALICTEPDLVDVFAVLASDVAQRMAAPNTSWTTVSSAVSEWQSLLAPRGKPSKEHETGLWGELWFVLESEDLDRAIASWRGPERDATDFFVDGVAAEIKTARIRRRHHVSQPQVLSPVGEHDAWMLSIWVKPDPGSTATVPALVDGLLERVADPGGALKSLLKAGYAPANRQAYATAFRVLAEPEWFAAGVVPRVRAADTGVSHLRYTVSLDESMCADAERARELWRHFHGHDYGGK